MTRGAPAVTGRGVTALLSAGTARLTAAGVPSPRVDAELLLAHLDPDGREPREEELERRRGFALVTNPDGSATPRGLLTPEVTALWQAILDSLAAPVASGHLAAEHLLAAQAEKIRAALP